MIRSVESLARFSAKRQHVGLHRRYYQSETLKWASKHRQLAQECLNIPTTVPTTGVEPSDLTQRHPPWSSLEAYLGWRQWNIPAEVQMGDMDKAKAIVSHVLSAPLTAASQLFPTFRASKKIGNQRMHWCCLGARAEASLPVEYWRELLILWDAVGGPKSFERCRGTAANEQRQEQSSTNHKVPLLDITIDFIGPDILRRPSVQLSYQGHSLTLRWLYNGTFHEYLDRSLTPTSTSDDMVLVTQPNWDAYIFYNPGLGHPNLRHDWEPTLQLLLSSSSKIGSTGNIARLLFTAHSSLDATRDTDSLIGYLLPEAPLYQDNPFASRITYEDPFEAGHLVRPNHCAYTLIWQ